jgi:uncharacterized RDD family membrane protein YckC
MAQVEQPRMVTPEAVALEFSTANVGSRILAFLIDVVIVSVVGFIAILVLVLTDATLPDGLVASILVILVPGWYFGYFAVSETLWRGRTIGKAALGLRVVTKEGGPVRFRHAAVRALLGLVDFALGSGFFAILLILLTRDNQRLGDLLAGTLVLRERSGLPAPAPVSFQVPPGLESYSAILDVSGLRTEEYQAVRTFLLRAPSLPPAPRRALAVQFADSLVERLRPPPPPGLQPEAFLYCVAAVYQRRQRAGAPAYPAAPPPPVSPWDTPGVTPPPATQPAGAADTPQMTPPPATQPAGPADTPRVTPPPATQPAGAADTPGVTPPPATHLAGAADTPGVTALPATYPAGPAEAPSGHGDVSSPDDSFAPPA